MIKSFSQVEKQLFLQIGPEKQDTELDTPKVLFLAFRHLSVQNTKPRKHRVYRVLHFHSVLESGDGGSRTYILQDLARSYKRLLSAALRRQRYDKIYQKLL